MPGNGVSDQDIVHNALVGQGLAGDRGGAVLQQPSLQGNPLIGVAISCNHWLPHHDLQQACQGVQDTLLLSDTLLC